MASKAAKPPAGKAPATVAKGRAAPAAKGKQPAAQQESKAAGKGKRRMLDKVRRFVRVVWWVGNGPTYRCAIQCCARCGGIGHEHTACPKAAHPHPTLLLCCR